MLDNFRAISLTWDHSTNTIYNNIRTASEDANGRKLVVQVVNGHQLEDLTSVDLRLYWEFDEHKGFDDFELIDEDNGIYEIHFSTDMVSHVGAHKAWLHLVDAEGTVTSEPFTVTVFEGVDADTIQDSNEFSALSNALVAISDLETNYAPRLNSVENNKADKATVNSEVSRLDQKDADLTAQLAQTANVLEAKKIDKNRGAVTSADLSQEVKEQMTGGSVAVVGNNAVNTENIIDQAVTRGKVSGVKSNNLFIKTTHLTQGAFVGTSGNIAPNANTSYARIPVEPETYYSLFKYFGDYTLYSGSLRFEDVNQEYISHTYMDGFVNGTYKGKQYITFMTPPETRYIAVSTKTNAFNNEDTLSVVEGVTFSGNEITEIFDLQISDKVLRENLQESWGTRTVDSLRKYGSVYDENLYDTKYLVQGQYINTNGEYGPNAATSLAHIPVEPETYYSLVKDFDNYTITSGTLRFEDVNKEKIQYNIMDGFVNGTYKGKQYITFMTPPETRYIALTTKANAFNDEDSLAVVKRNNLNGWEGEYISELYGLKIRDTYSENNGEAEHQKWHGKTFVTFGDSLTWYDGELYGANHKEHGTLVKGYQSYMREELGCNVINKGVSGRTMPNLLGIVRGTNFDNVDAVTITAGANDFRTTSEPVGEVEPIGSEFDESSYIGALQSAIEHIHSVNNEIAIFLITPVKGWQGADDREMPTTYPDGMKAVADLYSLAVCDFYYNSGVNKITKEVYMGDVEGMDDLHLSSKGYERVADILIPFLMNN